MALDAVCLQAAVREIAPQVEGLKIEKIQQPARDQVVLLRGSRRLLLCASASQPRLNLTEVLRDNPSQAPMFCMLLRKHLSGGRIITLRQEPLERVVTLEIEAMNELGEMGRFSLVLEAMNRHSNLILCGVDGRIIDCMRRVDFEMSQQRQVLPGLYYHLPPRQEKRSPLEVEEQEFRTLLESASPERQTDKWLLDSHRTPVGEGDGLSGRRKHGLPFVGCGRAAVVRIQCLAPPGAAGRVPAGGPCPGRQALRFYLCSGSAI